MNLDSIQIRFHRQKKTHQSLIFAAVSGNLPASSPDVSGVQMSSAVRTMGDCCKVEY